MRWIALGRIRFAPKHHFLLEAMSMRCAVALLSFALLISPAALAGPLDDPFPGCKETLAIAGHPPIEIHIQGESHPERGVANALLARVKAGEVQLLYEGAPYGADRPLSGVNGVVAVSASGPIFGVAFALATLLQELFFQYIECDASPFMTAAHHLRAWLRLAIIAWDNPRYFEAVVRTAPALSGMILLQTLAALQSTEMLRTRIADGEIPNPTDRAEVLKAFLRVAMDGIETQLPFLGPFFATPRAALGDLRAHGLEGVAEMVMVRNFFIAQSVAKIVARFHERKKFVLLVGVHHVADLERILRAQFAGVQNVQITVDENRAALDPRYAERDAAIRAHLLGRTPPASPQP